MLNPVHVVLRASMFYQAHSTSNMSWNTSSSCAFHALLLSELYCVTMLHLRIKYLESEQENHRHQCRFCFGPLGVDQCILQRPQHTWVQAETRRFNLLVLDGSAEKGHGNCLERIRDQWREHANAGSCTQCTCSAMSGFNLGGECVHKALHKYINCWSLQVQYRYCARRRRRV